MSKIFRECVTRNLGDRSGHFHASGPATDDDKSHCGLARRFIGDFFRVLESKQQTAAHLDRVLETFQARRQSLPFIVTEIGMAGASREN